MCLTYCTLALAEPTCTVSTVPDSPSNLIQRTEAYRSLSNVRVAPLYVSEQDLTVDRVLALLGWDNLQVSSLHPHVNVCPFLHSTSPHPSTWTL